MKRRLLLPLLSLGVAAGAWAGCREDLQEFAFLSEMDMAGESAAKYRELPGQCLEILAAGLGEERLPDARQQAQIAALGKRWYRASRDESARHAGAALAQAEVPEVDTQALGGIGVEDPARALGAMALDIGSAALRSRGQHREAGTVARLAGQLRGNEPGMGGAAHGRGAGAGAGGIGATAPAQPLMPVPAETAQASCEGAFGFLAPQLRAYASPTLRQVREAAVAQSMPGMIAQIRAMGLGKAQAIALSREQALEYDRGAAEAAATANQSDGRGRASIAQAIDDRLPLGFPCEGSAVHASAVCAFIAYRWGSLVSRVSAQMIGRCMQE